MEIKVERDQECDEFERIEKLNRLRRTNDGPRLNWFYMPATHGYPVSPALVSPYVNRVNVS